MPLNKFSISNMPQDPLHPKAEYGQVCTYHFSVFFEPDSHCSFFLLEAKTNAGSTWHQLIYSYDTDNDGEITIEIGHIAAGTKMDFRYGIYGIDALSNIQIKIINATTEESFTIRPTEDEDPISVKKGDSFTSEISDYAML